jgi:LacI family transcriptional regulator
MPPKRVTLMDVAKDAGVSRATASLVLRKSPLVTETTYDRVVASMERLGYVYNRAAASMRSNRSRTVGLIVTDITNPFFAQMTLGSEEHLNGEDYALLLGNSAETAAKQERLIEAMHEYGADGLLLCPVADTDPQIIRSIQQWHLPCIQVARFVPGVAADYVGPDNVLGAELATRQLVANGHRIIAFVGGPRHTSAHAERLQGYCAVLSSHDLPIDEGLVAPCPVSTQGGRSAITELMQRAQRPTAVFCYNDIVAHGVMLGLQALGITPGETFDVIGFDDIDEASQWHPALTTVAMPPSVIGSEAARLLIERIDNPEGSPRQVILRPALVYRQSCPNRSAFI